MHIQETPEKLILRDRPGCVWLLCAMFILLGGLFILGPLFLFSDRDMQPWYVSAAAIFLGSCAVGVGLWQINRVPLTMIIFDRLERKIRVVAWGLAGRKERCWLFSDMAGIQVIEEQDSEGDPVYRLQLELHTGELAWLTGVYLHTREPYDQAAGRVRAFTGL